MQEASRKTENQPGAVAGEPSVPSHEGMADWAGLAYGAGDEELHLERDDHAELPQDSSPADWEPDPQAGMGDLRAAVGDGDPTAEDEFVLEDDLRFEDEVEAGGGEPLGQLWDTTPARISLFEHPLYVEYMHALEAGKIPAAALSLQKLEELYPEEPALRHLRVRLDIRSAVAQERPLPAEHGAAAPALRGALSLLLILTIVLVGAAGFYVAFDNIVRPVWEERQRVATIEGFWADYRDNLERGAVYEARQSLLELQSFQGSSQEIEERLADVDRQIQLSNLYSDGRVAEDMGDFARAVALYQQLVDESPGYKDAEQRILDLQLQMALEVDWLEAENRLAAEDWEGAIALLLDIRRRDPDYRQDQVKERLFQINERLAWQAVNQAGGSVERLRSALVYLEAALAERPTNRDLNRQRELARAYVSGFAAWDRGDWLEAAQQWEKVNTLDRGYQGGVLLDRLKQAYPLAARQAIAEANGSVQQLEQAATYLDLALLDAPEDESLRQDRELVRVYLQGARAFDASFWNQAITHWGPLYAAQPGFQNGALERNLRQACIASPDPDLTLCPP